MRRSFFPAGLAGLAWICAMAGGAAAAEETVKVGLIMPMTGVLAPVGKQAVAKATRVRL